VAAAVGARSTQPQLHFQPRNLPLDAVAARIGCIASSVFEAEEPMREIEARLTRARFTGLVCVDYLTGETLTLYLADGVALGAALETPYGDYTGEDALDAAEQLPGPARVYAAPLPLSEAKAYA